MLSRKIKVAGNFLDFHTFLEICATVGNTVTFTNLWSEISMKHSLWMKVGQAFGNIQGQWHPECPWKFFFFSLDQLFKTSTIDVLKIVKYEVIADSQCEKTRNLLTLEKYYLKTNTMVRKIPWNQCIWITKLYCRLFSRNIFKWEKISCFSTLWDVIEFNQFANKRWLWYKLGYYSYCSEMNQFILKCFRE